MRSIVAAALAAGTMAVVGCGAGEPAPGGEKPRETTVSVYFLREAPCEVHPVPRTVTAASALERARTALELLLQGPSPEELEDGFRTAIPDSMRAWRHWQGHVAFGYDERMLKLNKATRFALYAVLEMARRGERPEDPFGAVQGRPRRSGHAPRAAQPGRLP